MTSYKEKLNDVNTFIFDVDGVLTNGEIILFKGEMSRTLNSRDGYAIQYAAKMGYRILIVTGGKSKEVKDRLEELGATEVCLGSSKKIEVYEKLKIKYGFEDHQALYMGDDIPDYEVMQKVGVATCPQDAVMEIKHVSHYESPYKGGQHCVRDVIEQTLRCQDKWFKEEAFTW
jgi:3-deoxy-D-manno-octulosonate 8-phosphate phosphatase (KDO 8-P phosphatase)